MSCKTCGAPMTWARTAQGLSIPIDPEPHPQGNIWFESKYRVIVASKEHPPPPDVLLYRSHWVTCANPPPRRKRTR